MSAVEIMHKRPCQPAPLLLLRNGLGLLAFGRLATQGIIVYAAQNPDAIRI